MANKIQRAAFMSSIVICFLSAIFIGDAHAAETKHFKIKGTVYCDPCRAKFVTRLSERMPGVKVKLECHNMTDGRVTLSIDTETDKNGMYHIRVEGDHEDEMCGVKPIKSNREDCNEIIADGWAKEFTRISLTYNSGVIGDVRRVNPILFLKTKRVPECAKVFQELHYIPDDLQQQP